MNVFPTLLNRWLLLALLPAVQAVHAHETHHDHSSDAGQSTLFFGGGMQFVAADEAWPSARLPGVLEGGNQREDERGSKLAYVEAGLNLSLSSQHSATLKVAKHGMDLDPEIEAFWVGGNSLGDDSVNYRIGRQQMPIGFLNRQEMHSWEMGAAPLAMRAVVNDSWRIDGLRFEWLPKSGFKIGTGLWYNQAFPGGVEKEIGVNVRSLSLGWSGGHLQLELGYADLDVNGRTLSTVGSARHTHSLPSCDTLDENRVCFFGKTEVVNLAAKWQAKHFELAGEIFYKRDRGRLDSLYGVPDYRGEFLGSWLDVSYPLNTRWGLIARIEAGMANHRFDGTNAELIADQASILDSEGTLFGYGLALNWRPFKGHFIGFEGHSEHFAGEENRLLMIRYQYNFLLGL
ncbi:hypothetical protein [Thiomicrorhabdus sp.]|uniref:hypothetical protein n=1 Tax=Thiomicrorhabdus sp. TaxID=2039724 RepID=UPI0029C6170F|nr:hypothetical protein [Thiomicrorhabdus sp.]